MTLIEAAHAAIVAIEGADEVDTDMRDAAEALRTAIAAAEKASPAAVSRPHCDLCGSNDDVVAYCATHMREFADREIARDKRLQGYKAKVAPAQVPLTERELQLIDGMIEVQLHHAQACDQIANRVMADKQKGWDMERVALLRKLKGTT